MANSLYLECETGISGDMAVAALLDLGADKDGLLKALATVPADGYEVNISTVKKAGLSCLDFDVVLDKQHENHDHDMAYLYGHLEDSSHHNHEHGEHHVSEQAHHESEHHHHEHSHEHVEEHHHEHHHEHGEHHTHEHHHEHRGIAEIKAIIEKTEISDNAKNIAVTIFEIIARAEAKAHGELLENVHFHEVGAIDSIVDVISIAYCVDDITKKYEIEKVIVPHVCEGSGSVRCQHGILPVPVPAVVNIVCENGIALKRINQIGEMVTPTGAAVVAAIKTDDVLPESYKIKAVGLGSGKRQYERPSILRAFVIA